MRFSHSVDTDNRTVTRTDRINALLSSVFANTLLFNNDEYFTLFILAVWPMDDFLRIICIS